MISSTADAPVPFDVIDRLVVEQTGQSLSDLQRLVLQECWQATKRTYDEIAAEYNYSGSYIQQRVAPSLWRLLSGIVGTKVTKSNCKGTILAYLSSQSASVSSVPTKMPAGEQPDITSVLTVPTDSVPLRSHLYIQRPSYEPACYRAILQPGALIRIKAPRQMGKTSLMNRIIAHSEDCQTIVLNFQQAEQPILSDLNRLLRWLCANLTSQLRLAARLDDFWDADLGSKMSCTLFLEEQVLSAINSPIILALEEASELFEYPKVAQDFFAMLRTWHEYTKSDEVWQSLRLLIVQSTETYIPLNINQSPFNVGTEIALKPFTPDQIGTLAQRYGLGLQESVIQQLASLVGGHPYLTSLALYQLATGSATWGWILTTASTDEGIFSSHLHRHLWNLQQHPDLAAAFKQVSDSDDPICLPQTQSFKLCSMGLVVLEKNSVKVSHRLYREYFVGRL